MDYLDGDPNVLVLVLHGLEGSRQSPYAAGILTALRDVGWTSVLLHFRGCSGEPNRLARSYHSGDTADLDFVLQHLHNHYPQARTAAVGFSLGGNVLLKYLGEQANDCSLSAAVAVSVPYDLADAADRLNRGFSQVYQRRLLHSLRAKTAQKRRAGATMPEISDLRKLNSFWDFDDRVTAPLHGFSDAEEYYTKASSRQFLPAIQVPTLLLHARDDPFMTGAAIPSSDELPTGVELALSNHGGHVGFVHGALPWQAKYWLEERIPGYLEGFLGRQ